jgi:hypothetical protein
MMRPATLFLGRIIQNWGGYCVRVDVYVVELLVGKYGILEKDWGKESLNIPASLWFLV